MPEHPTQDPATEEFARRAASEAESPTSEAQSDQERAARALKLASPFRAALAEMRARPDGQSRANGLILDQVEGWSVYHPPRPDQIPRYEALREAFGLFCLAIVENCPGSADRTAALRLAREAVMTGNASIALEPDPPTDPAP